LKLSQTLNKRVCDFASNFATRDVSYLIVSQVIYPQVEVLSWLYIECQKLP